MIRIKDKDLSPQAIELYLNSWRPKTRKLYCVYTRKWKTLCVINDWNRESPKLEQAISFLTSLFDKGLSYSAINIARCALSAMLCFFEGVPFGQHPVVTRIMKGIYNKRPQRSKYASTWDVDVVLSYLQELIPLRKLTLRDLTRKLVMLMLLTSCQRVQTLHVLQLEDLLWSQDGKTGVFRLSKTLKHSKRGSLGVITFHEFKEDPRICVIRTLKEYVNRTSELRQTQKDSDSALFIATTPPFRQASRATIARWVKEVLSNAGIETKLFTAHSVRGASTSKLANLHVSVQEIMNKGSWKSESTFQKFYNKTLLPTDVSQKMLSSFVSKQ